MRRITVCHTRNPFQKNIYVKKNTPTTSNEQKRMKIKFYFFAKYGYTTPVLSVGEATEKQEYIITSTYTHFNNIFIELFFIYLSSDEGQVLHSELI